MKIKGEYVYPGTSVNEAKFAVSGHHKELGSGILFWTRQRNTAEYNAKVVNETGGEAIVETKAEALS